MRAVLLALVLAIACAPGAPPSEASRELRLAAASNLVFVLQEIVPDFEAREDAKVKLTTGASGNFYAQIANGAPLDVFLSADMVYPKRLAEAGLAEPAIPYATGRLVLWSRKLPTDGGMQSLLSADKVAIANPELAPYGQAAVAAMEHYGVYAQLKPKLVLGENVSQTAQFAESGAADAALIPLSLAAVAPLSRSGTYWIVPAKAHEPIAQAGSVLRGAANPALARAFMAFLTDPEGKEILSRYGFEAP